MKLRMATRGSALALAQSGILAAELKALEPGLEIETVVIKTSGDRFSAANPDAPIAPAGGAKGLFIKEIEEALRRGEADFAVHSGKDLPAALAPGLKIAAYPKREDARDAFIGRGGAALKDLPQGARVATASLRRQIQLKRARPDLAFIVMRGNVDTRLRKLTEGQCDGLVLAEAGLKRLGRAEVKRELLSVELMVPAPAQGALAVETRAEDSEAARLVARLDDAATRAAVELERGVLEAVGGGCHTPLGVYARDGVVDAFLSKADGADARRVTRRGASAVEIAAALRGA